MFRKRETNSFFTVAQLIFRRVLSFLYLLPFLLAAENVANAEGQITYRVRPGDTISALARKFSVSKEHLMTANEIQDPKKLRAWDHITIPDDRDRDLTQVVEQIEIDHQRRTESQFGQANNFRKYRLFPGDMVVTLAKKFSVPQEVLMQVNKITDPRKLRAWDWILIPATSGTTDEADTALIAKEDLLPSQTEARKALSFRKYRIVPGDVLGNLAAKFAVTQLDLVLTNNLEDPNMIFAGRTLLVPERGPPTAYAKGEQESDKADLITAEIGVGAVPTEQFAKKQQLQALNKPLLLAATAVFLSEKRSKKISELITEKKRGPVEKAPLKEVEQQHLAEQKTTPPPATENIIAKVEERESEEPIVGIESAQVTPSPKLLTATAVSLPKEKPLQIVELPEIEKAKEEKEEAGEKEEEQILAEQEVVSSSQTEIVVEEVEKPKLEEPLAEKQPITITIAPELTAVVPVSPPQEKPTHIAKLPEEEMIEEKEPQRAVFTPHLLAARSGPRPVLEEKIVETVEPAVEKGVKVVSYDKPAEETEEIIAPLDNTLQLQQEHFERALDYSRQQEFDLAISEFKKALGFDPDNTATLINLGLTYHRKGENKNAIREIKKAVSLDPDSAEGHYNLGTVYLAMNRLMDAIIELGTAIQIDPEYGEAYANLGYAYYNFGRMDEALATFKKFARIAEKTSRLQSTLPRVKKIIKELEETTKSSEHHTL